MAIPESRYFPPRVEILLEDVDLVSWRQIKSKAWDRHVFARDSYLPRPTRVSIFHVKI